MGAAAPSNFVCIPLSGPPPISSRPFFASALWPSLFLPPEACWLAALYLAAVLVQSIAVLSWRKWFWLPQIMSLIFVSHVVYGLGFWRGCLTRPQPPPPAVAASVQIEKVQ